MQEMVVSGIIASAVSVEGTIARYGESGATSDDWGTVLVEVGGDIGGVLEGVREEGFLSDERRNMQYLRP